MITSPITGNYAQKLCKLYTFVTLSLHVFSTSVIFAMFECKLIFLPVSHNSTIFDIKSSALKMPVSVIIFDIFKRSNFA